MKIFAVGLETETNTFSSTPMGMYDFDVTRPEDINEATLQFAEVAPVSQWLLKKNAGRDQPLSGLYAWAHPTGLTTKSTYENLRNELLRSHTQPGDESSNRAKRSEYV